MLLLSTFDDIGEDDDGENDGFARISQILNVRRVVELFIGEICAVNGELFDRLDDEFILLGERIRLVNDVSLLELIGAGGDSGVGKAGVPAVDDDERLVVFNCSSSSSLLGKGTVVVSNLSSLIRREIRI